MADNPFGQYLVLGSLLSICNVFVAAACSAALPVWPVMCTKLCMRVARAFPGDPWVVLAGAIEAHS